MVKLVSRIVWFLAAIWAASGTASADAPSELRGHGGPVKAVAMLDDTRTLVSGGFDSALIVWDLATGTARQVLRFHGSTVNAVVALPGGCFASGGEDARIAIWCGDATTPNRILDGHAAPVTSLAVSSDGRFVASTSFDRTLRVWPVDGVTPARVFEGYQAPLSSAAFLPDGSGVVIVGYDGTVRIVPLDDTVAPRPFSVGVPVNAVAVTPQGEVIVAGADGHVRRLSRRLEPLADFDIGSGPLTALALTPDTRFVATAGMRTQVTLIEAASGKVAFEILGPGLPVWALAFSADGSILTTGGQDRSIRRWVTATGAPSGPLASAETEVALPFASERGAEIFRACRACHGVTLGDTMKAGPTLAGLFGRRIATAPGYVYSDALKGMDIVWSPDTIAKLFTLGPAAYTPGTKMPEQTLTDAADRDALIAWLAKATQ